MNDFKTITLKDGSEWACNKDGEGIFARRTDSTWGQHAGTSQTPRFKDPAALSRYVHKNYRDHDGGKLPRMVKSAGWS